MPQPKPDPTYIHSVSSIVLQARCLYRDIRSRPNLKASELEALLICIELIEKELKGKKFG